MCADGSRWCRCVSIPTSKHIHNAGWSWGDHVGLALSCLISNGRLPGDSTCQPPEPPVFSQVPYGRPSPIPLAGLEQRQEQVWTPALLAFPWHCHRACPAHCQLPTLGQRTQQPLPTWVWQQPATGYSEKHASMRRREYPKNLFQDTTDKMEFVAEPSHTINNSCV